MVGFLTDCARFSDSRRGHEPAVILQRAGDWELDCRCPQLDAPESARPRWSREGRRLERNLDTFFETRKVFDQGGRIGREESALIGNRRVYRVIHTLHDPLRNREQEG